MQLHNTFADKNVYELSDLLPEARRWSFVLLFYAATEIIHRMFAVGGKKDNLVPRLHGDQSWRLRTKAVVHRDLIVGQRVPCRTP